jgi:hypothetical protein
MIPRWLSLIFTPPRRTTHFELEYHTRKNLPTKDKSSNIQHTESREKGQQDSTTDSTILYTFYSTEILKN